jgi:hypothetical protein
MKMAFSFNMLHDRGGRVRVDTPPMMANASRDPGNSGLADSPTGKMSILGRMGRGGLNLRGHKQLQFDLTF